MEFAALSQACAPSVHPDTMRAIVQVESAFNPYAIGVVGGRLAHQPHSEAEALKAVENLEDKGYNYSLGIAQVNKHNLTKYGLSLKTVFNPCDNLRAGADILSDCYRGAHSRQADEQGALRDAFSCYYSGSFTLGHRLGYVAKVVNAGTDDKVMVPKIISEPEDSSAANQPVSIRLKAGFSRSHSHRFSQARRVMDHASPSKDGLSGTTQSALLF